MAVGIGIEQVTGGAAEPGTGLPSPARRRRALRLPRSPKILVGLGLLAFFVLLAIFGPIAAPYSPDRVFANSPVPLPPSGAHWLGTTNLQQDVFSQLLVGGGDLLLVSFIFGLMMRRLPIFTLFPYTTLFPYSL